MRSIILFLLVGFSSLGIFGQTKTAVGIEDIYLAKDDGSGKAGDAATTFSTSDIPIYCVVQLDSTEPVTVKMNLVAENVPGVKAETKVVSTTYTTKGGENRVNFYGKPAGKWTAGRYRADIFIDGKVVKTLVFDIKSAASTVAARAYVPSRVKAPVAQASRKNP